MEKTRTFVRKEEPYRAGYYIRLPKRNANETVLLYSSRTHKLMEVDSSLSADMISKEKFDKQITIDMREAQFWIDILSPCVQETYNFCLRIKFGALIKNAMEYYQSGQFDVPETIKDIILPTTKSITTQFEIMSATSIIESRVSQELDKIHGLDVVGIQYRVLSATCKLDTEASQYRSDIEKIQREKDTKLEEIRHKNAIKEEMIYSAERMQILIGNDDTKAIFTQVFEGSITIEEAQTKVRELEKERLDGQFKNAERFIDLIRSMSPDILGSAEISRMVKMSFAQLPGVDPKMLDHVSNASALLNEASSGDADEHDGVSDENLQYEDQTLKL